MKMYELPDERGHFGRYGGVFVAETLVHALDELRRAYEACRKDPEFVAAVQRQGLDLDPVGAAELAEVVRGIYALPEAAVEGARDLLPAL